MRVASRRTYHGSRYPSGGRITTTVNVLFVCEDNTTLSVMAEAILRSVAPGRFGAYSAGLFPGAVMNPDASEFLHRHHLAASHLRPKSLQAFRGADAARMDFIITLCDSAADEDFSAWPGEPFIAHWNIQDEYTTGEADEVVRDNFWTLMRRIKIFTSLPHGKLSRRLLEERALRLQPSYL